MNTITVIFCSIFVYCGALDGYCGPYLGDVCKKYIDTSNRFVWYNITTGKIENENITKGLWQEMIVGLREPCRSSAEVINYLLINSDCRVELF